MEVSHLSIRGKYFFPIIFNHFAMSYSLTPLLMKEANIIEKKILK